MIYIMAFYFVKNAIDQYIKTTKNPIPLGITNGTRIFIGR
jgi:hypothetical protein